LRQIRLRGRRLRRRGDGDSCREQSPGAAETVLYACHSRRSSSRTRGLLGPAARHTAYGERSPPGRPAPFVTAVVAASGSYDIGYVLRSCTVGRRRPRRGRGAAQGPHRAACAATMSATHAVRRLPVAMCRNSFGPCAFECGPSTPVTRNCALGKRSASMFMNGMVPPVPMYIASRPKKCRDAVCSASSSHGARGGAFQPAMQEPISNVTVAPYGGSLSSAVFTLRAAASGSTPGGSRNESFTLE